MPDKANGMVSGSTSGSGQDEKMYLTHAHIKGLEAAVSPLTFEFPLANGVREVGPYPVLEGAGFGGWLCGLFSTVYTDFGNEISKQVSRNSKMRCKEFDYRSYKDEVETISAVSDASDPDIDDFRTDGDKLLVPQGANEMQVPPAMTTDYWDNFRIAMETGRTSLPDTISSRVLLLQAGIS